MHRGKVQAHTIASLRTRKNMHTEIACNVSKRSVQAEMEMKGGKLHTRAVLVVRIRKNMHVETSRSDAKRIVQADIEIRVKGGEVQAHGVVLASVPFFRDLMGVDGSLPTS